ncbi:hypothetical protein OHB26_38880 (plasmid) [Nocardia sp. NBC_01503]|uniref:hypothetical protein n=1 Tax=Nocardia sp. NBC_01503 TaxID=2975997 RepID=UPI002E7C1948|nr:hypothetical protein [Nocardia sp. NBC_01503]WTL36644.1 hypothetical protein OHB26_38880 [Nocardia sp. NBC_01503]
MAPQRPRIVRKANRTRLWAYMPFENGKNRAWLKSELGHIRPHWNKPEQRWEIARTHLWTLAEAMAEKFGEVELTLEFNKTERCNRSCQNAVNDVSECVCSCLGEYHGGRGERREWVRSGAHTLISKGPTHVTYLIVHRREPILETVGPEPEPAAPPPLPEPAPSNPVADPIPAEPVPAYPSSITNSPRHPAPARPRPAPAREQFPPGCGLAAFLLVLAVVCGVLAVTVTVNVWWWIGVGVLLFVIFVIFAENA